MSAEGIATAKGASTSELFDIALSVDHSAPVPIEDGGALFLSMKVGMAVIVKHLPEIDLKGSTSLRREVCRRRSMCWPEICCVWIIESNFLLSETVIRFPKL